jgi:ABC-2 type transport system ATP-binding protein
MIDAETVVFDHPSGRALHGVGFVVRAGAVAALVGPVGAGKSTLLRCIAALDHPTSGRISVAGLDTQDDPRGVHALIGYLPDAFGLYQALSLRQCLAYAARARGVPEPEVEAAIARAAERVGLAGELDWLAGELPPPARVRLALGQAIVHSPRVLLLDQPLAGLQGFARDAMAGLVRRLAAGGVTALISAIELDELDDICTDVLRLEAGRLVDGGVLRLPPQPPRPPPAEAPEAETPEAEPPKTEPPDEAAP